MPQVNINTILARYQSGFGYVAGNVASVVANRLWAKLVNMPLYAERLDGGTSDESIDLFPVTDIHFAEVEFKNSKSGNKYNFGTDIVSYGIGKKFLAPPLMLSFNRDKNVCITPIDKSEIEVIENFGLKSYNIKVQGLVVDMDNHQYPGDLLRKISEMFAEWGTYEVTSTIFNDMDICEMFIKGGLDVSFVEGYADTVKFSFDAISTAVAAFNRIKEG